MLWSRPISNNTNRPQFAHRQRVAPFGGKLTFSIVETRGSAKVGGGPSRSPQNRILAQLQREARLGGKRPSDEVETFRFDVVWEPSKNALGVDIAPEFTKRFKKLEVVCLSVFQLNSLVFNMLYYLPGTSKFRLRKDITISFRKPCLLIALLLWATARYGFL